MGGGPKDWILPMQTRTHFLLLASLATVVIALRLAGRDYYRQDYASRTLQGATVRQNEIERNWQNLAYTNAALGKLVEPFFERIRWTSLGVPSPRQERLKERLRELFRYLGDPTFENYYRLKAEGLHYDFHPGPEAVRLLAMARRGKDAKSDLPAKETTRILWRQVHERGGVLVLPKITAVSLDRVAYMVNHTNSGKALLLGRKVLGFTVGREAVNPGFQYTGAQEHSAGTSENPLLFDFGFLAKFNGTDTAGPVFVSLRWSDKDQTWVLNRLITDNLLNISTLF